MKRKLLEAFRNPGSQYRGAPFWAWNGKLEPEELRRQIRLMHHMGLGGFFMHSRVGLDTVYLSAEWFECVSACIDEAEKLDMQAWLYDEDRWPSGAAGGLVTKDPKHRMRSLVMDTFRQPRDFKWSTSVLAAFTAEVDGDHAKNVSRLPRGKRPPRAMAGRVILAFRVKLNDCSSWYNNYTYLDTMSHEAVQAFIRTTHETYRKRIGEHLGKRVPGIFTDEPNYGDGAPWTDKLPAVFRKRYGYNILDRLPELLFIVDGQAISQARHNYHDCITHLFVDAFARQLGEWCERNGMLHTGHVLQEGDLIGQTTVVGTAMRFYEYMHSPGMDILTEHWREYDTAKQVSSVARQFGRKWRLTETYGCTGWDFPFVGHKAIGDWQLALGINLRCPHLSWYTMEGQAKRDYPAAIFYQSPWWGLYPKVEDYFARVHAVMTRGKEVRDLLVIHPIESVWALGRRGRLYNDPSTMECNSVFRAFRDSLLKENIDFDYGDEDMLARHGKCRKVKGEPALHLGQATYKAVVVPQMLTIRGTTLALLKRFQAAGGRVVFAGKPPAHVDAVPNPAAKEFAKPCAKAPVQGKRLADSVADVARRVSITSPDGREIAPALYLLREDRDAFYLFVCNSGHTSSQLSGALTDDSMARDRKAAFPDVRIEGLGECVGRPVELDPDTGEIFDASARRLKNKWSISTTLPPIGSRLFMFPKKRSRTSWPGRERLKTVRSTGLGTGPWPIGLSENNVLVLDRPRHKIGAARWRKPDDILRVDFAVRDALGIPRRGGQMVQPWARIRPETTRSTTVRLAYTFEVKDVPSGDLLLALERPGTFRAEVNGTSISMDAECGWWCDRSLRTLRIDPSLIRSGANELFLTCDYREDHPGLEIVYLLGTFGVKVKGADVVMTRCPETLRTGDWVKQGLPFYAGSVAYRKTIRPKLRKGERLFVTVPEYRGTAARIMVNGTEAGIIAWEPNEVDITDLLDDSPADLRIEIISHRRNSHGPLHLTVKWPHWTGPDSFTSTGKMWTDNYQLVPCGLMAEPRLEMRKT